jgi:Zn-dependent protease
MKWSWKIGQFAGIGVYMHATFLLLVGWVAVSHWVQARTLEAVLAGVGFILALFACVVAHEYGHALTARHYGIRTKDITLLPIGGVARLERMPDDPRQELWVALAGPAVNVVIAAALFAWLVVTDTFSPLAELSVARGSFLERLMVVNAGLVLFNLLPAFPMDGGRVMRALLATRMEYTRATQLAANVGQGVAVREVMQREFQVVDSSDMLESAMQRLQECACHTLPVQHGGRVVGLLTMDNVGEFVAIQAALGGTPTAPALLESNG